MQLLTLALTDIQPNPSQPRKAFEANALADLADSIRANGVIQPIAVRPGVDGYEIIAGERRWRASAIAGRESIPAVCYEGATDEETFVMATLENCARKDMKPIEEARAFAQIRDMGKTTEQIAALVGRATFAVAWRLELLNLAPEFQDVDLPLNVGRLMSRMSIGGQRTVMRRFVGGDFKTTQECEKFCNAVIAREAQVEMFAPSQLDAFGADDIRRERAAVNRSRLATSWAKITAVGAMLTPFDETTEQDIADAFDCDLDARIAEARTIEAAMRRMRIRLETAKALQSLA